MNQHLELVALRLFSQRWLSDCFLHGRCEFANALSCGRSSLTTMCVLFCRIPEGQSDGPISSGRLRSLEEQLSRAKHKIHSFQRLSGDGKREDHQD